MGSGKGAPDYWVAVVKPGRVLFEVAGVDRELATSAMTLAASKLPVKCKVIAKEQPEAAKEIALVETGGDSNESE
jgi:large subunit ribosomal protein L16